MESKFKLLDKVLTPENEVGIVTAINYREPIDRPIDPKKLSYGVSFLPSGNSSTTYWEGGLRLFQE